MYSVNQWLVINSTPVHARPALRGVFRADNYRSQNYIRLFLSYSQRHEMYNTLSVLEGTLNYPFPFSLKQDVYAISYSHLDS